MKATGIVRKVDELGRVVIPKEIRKTSFIKEGTPLEIFTDDGGEIILKKYSLVKNIKNYADECTETIYELFNLKVIVFDKDELVAFRGMSEKTAQTFLIENRIQNNINFCEIQNYENGKFYIEPIKSQGIEVGGILVIDFENLTEKFLGAIKSMAILMSKFMD